MSDSAFLLLFLVVPLLWALWWLSEDWFHGAPAATAIAVLCLAGMLLLVVWMVVALREGAGAP